VEQLVEERLAGETEVLGENLPQRHLVHHKSHLTRPEIEPGPPRWKPETNRLSYGAAYPHARSKRALFKADFLNAPFSRTSPPLDGGLCTTNSSNIIGEVFYHNLQQAVQIQSTLTC
jgi:hypothetical protein